LPPVATSALIGEPEGLKYGSPGQRPGDGNDMATPSPEGAS